MARTLTSTSLVVTVAVAMLTMTIPALATHNTVGPTTSLWVENSSTAPADIGEDLFAEYHTEAAEAGLIPAPRGMPMDARGAAYQEPHADLDTGNDCVKSTDATYQDELARLGNLDIEEYDGVNDSRNIPAEDRETDICWIGYFNVNYQRLIATSGLIFFADPIYPYNPDPNDGYCNGEEGFDDEEERVLPPAGVDPVDQAVANVERINSEECDGSGHEWQPDNPFWLAIDDAFLEAPVNDDDFTPGVRDEVGNQGSSSLTFPGISQGYALLFGQPHPLNENPSSFEAGEGPFAPAPGTFAQDGFEGISTLVGDLDGACGDRTDACTLLTPTDLQLYDTNRPSAEDIDDPLASARLCNFSPQFSAVSPGDWDAGICGPTGQAFSFFDPTERGGLGIQDGPPTFVGTLPGFHTTRIPIEIPTNFEYYYYNVVNPAVVTDQSQPLWCVVPGFLAEGDDDVAGASDPGFYGPYDADAISTHVRHHTSGPVLSEGLGLASGPINDALDTANQLLEEGLDQEELDEVQDQVNDTLNELPDVPELPEDEIDEAIDTTNEGIDRAWPFAPGIDKPYHEVGPDSDGLNQNAFTITTEAGVGCNDAGDPEIKDEEIRHGGILFDTGISQQTIALDDKTIFDDEDLPQRQSEADRGTWQADSYWFGGVFQGVIDGNNNSVLEECPAADGQVQADDDRCVWESWWDVYNTGCDIQATTTSCQERAESAGYAVDPGVGEYDAADGVGGVGMFFVLTVTGTTVVTDTVTSTGEIADGTFEERTEVLGSEDPAATNCVIGTSIGFDDYLPGHLGVNDLSGLAGELCPEATGDVHVMPDAFNDQASTAPGDFSGSFEWIKLAPTPDATSATIDAQGDELCLATLWSMQANHGTAAGTEGNLEHTSSDSPIVYGECLDLSTDSSNHEPWDPIQ